MGKNKKLKRRIMAHPSKQKGNRFERQIVELCKIWQVACKRAWGSNGESLGLPAEVDCVIEDDFRVQAKVRKKISSYLIPSEDVDAVVFKQDRGEVLMLVRFEDWLAERKIYEEMSKAVGRDTKKIIEK